MTMIRPRSDVVYGIYRGLPSGCLPRFDISTLGIYNTRAVYNQMHSVFKSQFTIFLLCLQFIRSYLDLTTNQRLFLFCFGIKFKPVCMHAFTFKLDFCIISESSQKVLNFYVPEIEDRGAYCFCPVCHSVNL